jgi:hypothetical protein
MPTFFNYAVNYFIAARPSSKTPAAPLLPRRRTTRLFTSPIGRRDGRHERAVSKGLFFPERISAVFRGLMSGPSFPGEFPPSSADLCAGLLFPANFRRLPRTYARAFFSRRIRVVFRELMPGQVCGRLVSVAKFPGVKFRGLFSDNKKKNPGRPFGGPEVGEIFTRGGGRLCPGEPV